VAPPAGEADGGPDPDAGEGEAEAHGGGEVGPPAPDGNAADEAEHQVGHLTGGEAEEEPVLDVEVGRDLVAPPGAC
jgi:hypothetical protein